MKKSSKKISMIIETENETLHFSLMFPALNLSHDAVVQISNLQRPPYFSIDGQPALLKEHETKLIEQLLDVCSYYYDKGDSNLAELVDKIGIALMQSFLTRHQNSIGQPTGNGMRE